MNAMCCIEHTHAATTEMASSTNEAGHHGFVGFQQIFLLVGVQLQHEVIGIDGILNFLYFVGSTQHMFAFHDGRYLVDSEAIVLNG